MIAAGAGGGVVVVAGVASEVVEFTGICTIGCSIVWTVVFGTVSVTVSVTVQVGSREGVVGSGDWVREHEVSKNTAQRDMRDICFI